MPTLALPAWLLPKSLLGRLSLVMVAGVLMTQLVGNLIWATQLRKGVETESKMAAQQIALSGAGSIRFFLSLPSNYRPILIQQVRELGGTRFFVNVNRAPIAIHSIDHSALADTVIATIAATLQKELPRDYRIGFAWPGDLTVSDSGSKITELPDSWVQQVLLVKPRPAPILVIQTELEPGHWFLLAALMPNPYFLEDGAPLSLDRVLLQGLLLATVLLLSIPLVRWTTRPLAALSDAAEAFGKGEKMPPLPESGSREFIKTARAFGSMRERIERHLEDRDRLFASISHDLRTPITRIKLRSDLLDDEVVRLEFMDDLDELDMMVKGALQCVRDTDIHENRTEVRLDALLELIIREWQSVTLPINLHKSGLSVMAKPLALKRAIGNILSNALHYGKKADISVRQIAGHVEIRIRDYGPGMPEGTFSDIFDPYVRLDHGRDQNAAGMGLGLGIARSIIQAHGGALILENHVDGGLIATLQLPAN